MRANEHGMPLKKGSPVPGWYRCQDCGTTGVKLWHRRLYQTAFHPQKLQCRNCAETGLAGEDAVSGFHGLVPVVPKDPFWNHVLVPKGGMEWWQDLPDKAEGS